MPSAYVAFALRRNILLIPACCFVLLTSCSTSPRSQERVRENTARATAVIASNAKSAVLGIRDGLSRKPVETGININTATRAELMTLPGVNAKIASDIIRNRPYTDPNQLRKEKIVPKAVYKGISGRLTVLH